MNMLHQPDLPSDIVDRITAAADQLFADGGHHAFPGVDQVRRRAKVNMNHAALVMKAWRQAHITNATPAIIAAPERVHQSGLQLIATLWQEATALAGASLQTAQAGWEQERAAAEALRLELADAFDQLSTELTAALRQLDQATTLQQQQQSAALADQEQINALEKQLTAVMSEVAIAASATAELRRHIDDLQYELTQTHTELRQLLQQLERQTATAETERTRLTLVAQTQTDLAASAQVVVAQLRGQLSAAELHQQQLMQTLQPGLMGINNSEVETNNLVK